MPEHSKMKRICLGQKAHLRLVPHAAVVDVGERGYFEVFVDAAPRAAPSLP